MKLKSIKYTKKENPETITVVLSVKEAAYVVKIIGAQTGNDANEIMAGGDSLNSSLYRCLASVFNMHWENGIGGYLRGDKE